MPSDNPNVPSRLYDNAKGGPKGRLLNGVGDWGCANYAELPVSAAGGVGVAVTSLAACQSLVRIPVPDCRWSPVPASLSVVDPDICQTDLKRSHFMPKHESPREQSFCKLRLEVGRSCEQASNHVLSSFSCWALQLKQTISLLTLSSH